MVTTEGTEYTERMLGNFQDDLSNRQEASGEYLDTYFAVSDGNILQSLRDLFPNHLHYHFDSAPPVFARWERMERRIPSRNVVGHFFAVPRDAFAAWRGTFRARLEIFLVNHCGCSPRILSEPRPYDRSGYNTLFSLFETIYTGFPRDPAYPGSFNTDFGPALPFVSIEESQLVIWCAQLTFAQTD